MEIFLRVDRVEKVLLEDGWHWVEPDTFGAGEYGFTQFDGKELKVIAWPSPEAHDRVWVTWSEGDGSQIAAPLSSVRGVRLRTEDSARGIASR